MWEELYRQHYPELLNYCIGACRDAEQAEDLVQETFLKAMQNEYVFADLGECQQRAWLFRTMKNMLMDSYRKKEVENRYAQYFLPEESAQEPGFGQTENALLLEQLPQEERTLFHLRYIEGYNASELAEMFHMPAGTVRAKLSKSRKILKNSIFEK